MQFRLGVYEEAPGCLQNEPGEAADHEDPKQLGKANTGGKARGLLRVSRTGRFSQGDIHRRPPHLFRFAHGGYKQSIKRTRSCEGLGAKYRVFRFHSTSLAPIIAVYALDKRRFKEQEMSISLEFDEEASLPE